MSCLGWLFGAALGLGLVFVILVVGHAVAEMEVYWRNK